ncbi:MAG: hypothetical protein CMD28_03870 [Flavobacteriales bacterium]|jgi:hypothetical protein|nr:hypothetical protein [Flavobacteriales bacterium]|tara:strand:- start:68 stop:892 length:825 start_codon:yes stop_codon:yes gene_type:complete
MNINRIIAILLIISIISCKKSSDNDIPSYITIGNFTLDGNSTHNITDAWVYIDDNLQGVYEIPANFPVLAQGSHKLRVKAGIKDNGIAGNRIPYPFYSSYIIDEQTFNPETTISITPVVSYLENATLDDKAEDFDGNGLNLETDSATFSIDDEMPLDGNYGVITLADSILLTELTTKEFSDLPQAGAPVYLELDYKCNTQFLVGVYINFPQSSILQKDLLWVRPKDEWNKIYINLTSTISEGVGADSFKIFIGMQRDFTMESNTIHLDNLRIVY